MIYSSHTFTFDHVYDQRAKQAEVYDKTARDAVHSVLAGYNATIIAYGQTGTGKTYTMEGQNGFGNSDDHGVIPRATEDIFNCKSHSTVLTQQISNHSTIQTSTRQSFYCEHRIYKFTTTLFQTF
jgi:hypothetical protein